MFIMGTNLKLWLKLLLKNKFNVSLRYIPRVFIISLVVSFFTPLVLYEHLRFRKQIRKVKIDKHPIFIIGHWRTGTTHLQNLLLNDDQFGYLNLIEATFPYLLLGNYKLIHFLMKPLIPKTRAMDSMEMNPETPQEHEFALTNLCLHSPLTSLFFLNKEEEYLKYALFNEVYENEFKEWKSAFSYLINKLTLKEEGKQLLLKNPLDTFRIKILLELYPKSKFIHIYRDPYNIFYSMVKLYQTNTNLFWLHKPNFNLHDFIFRIYSSMNQDLYKEIKEIPTDQFIEIRYEDLISNTSQQLKRIYNHLSLGKFEIIKEKVDIYIDSLEGYEVDSYSMSKAEKQHIYSKWKESIDKWNYEKPS